MNVHPSALVLVPPECPKGLTDIGIRNIVLPTIGRLMIWDTQERFGLRVTPNGTKTFIVLLGPGRRLAIGRYPTISLQQARQKAKLILAERTLGKHTPKATSWDTALEEYLAACLEKNRASTFKEYKRILQKFHFGRLLDITKADVKAKLDRIKKTSMRAHTINALKIFFEWCIKQDYLEHNPCKGLVGKKSTPRARVLDDTEIKAISEAAGYCGTAGIIVRILLRTGQRRSEISQLRVEYFEPTTRTITLPATLTKNKRTHSFPVSSYLATVLMYEIKTWKRMDYFFPARDTDGAFRGWSAAKPLLDKLSGVSGWTLHDIRRTYRTIHARIGTPPHIAERLINHVSARNPVETVYDRYNYMPEMVKAVSAYEAELTKILSRAE